MSNGLLTTSLIANEALAVLDNNLVMANNVFRGYENEFDKKVNGYQPGETISIRVPADFTVRSGATMAVQDVIEGKTSITLDRQKGVDFKFSSTDLTLKIEDLSKRVIEPAMVQLANEVDADLMSLYADVPNWVGTPGQDINSYADFIKGPQRLNELAVPIANRYGTLSPADHAGLLGSQTALYMEKEARGAYREASLGRLAGVDTFMTQNVPTHTVGAIGGTVKVDASITASTVSYVNVKDTMTQTVHIDGLTSATATIKKGDVFTIAGVYAVNPVTKARLKFLKQFTVKEDATAASNEVDLVISPAMIWSGAQKNVDVVGVTDLNNQDVTFLGSAGESYNQNMVFHKNAFALVMVPMITPPGAVDVARKSSKSTGSSVRMIPTYDGTNDVSAYRLDILYGVKAIDPRLATRLSGTS